MLVYNEICVYSISCTDELALYSTVYYHIGDCGSRVYVHDRGYEGGNLTSRVA